MHTKILATLGPASARPEVLDAMIAAGLDAVRLNFSHGTRDWHAGAVKMVRDAEARAGSPIAILADLQGPKIRVGNVRGGEMDVPTGSILLITARPVEGKDGVVSTEYEDLPGDLKEGEKVLLDDGRIQLEVESVQGPDIRCRVTDGGTLSSHKGINVPGAALRAASLTDKDREDARFALSLEVDYLALSFVRRARDVLDLRDLMASERRGAPIIAKIEKPQALEALEEIIGAADGLMVARGDLGVEAPLELIPVYQKRIIEAANRAGKLVITATQMLESMTSNPLPTRAEVTDVANAILNGTDVVMLSAETSVGKFPVDAVRQMAKIAVATEESIYPFAQPVWGHGSRDRDVFTHVIASMAGHACREIEPRAVVVFSRTGRTARIISFERVHPKVVAFTPDRAAYRRLALHWGILPRMIGEIGSAADLHREGEKLLVDGGFAGPGDTVLYISGTSLSEGTTNSVRLARIGE